VVTAAESDLSAAAIHRVGFLEWMAAQQVALNVQHMWIIGIFFTVLVV
jgi:hypothetical protein